MDILLPERKIFPIKSYLFNILNPSLSSSNKGNKHKAFFIFWKILSWLLTSRLYWDVILHSWVLWNNPDYRLPRDREREGESFILSKIWTIIHHPQYYILSAKWPNKSEVSYIYIQIAILPPAGKRKKFYIFFNNLNVEARIQCWISQISSCISM